VGSEQGVMSGAGVGFGAGTLGDRGGRLEGDSDWHAAYRTLPWSMPFTVQSGKRTLSRRRIGCVSSNRRIGPDLILCISSMMLHSLS
jgi:hypothetical protein